MPANKIRNLCIVVAFTGLLFGAPGTSPAKLEGVLIDQLCSQQAHTRIVPGPRIEGGIVVAYTHTKECALKPECRKSGYGVFTYDQKFVPFDSAGNQQAFEFFRNSSKTEDFRVAVTGEFHGDLFHVAAITPLP